MAQRPPDPSNASGIEGQGRVVILPDSPHLATLVDFPVADGWAVTTDIALDHGQLVIANLNLYPWDGGERQHLPDSGMTTAVLRKIKTGDIINRVHRELRLQPGLAARWEEFLEEPVPTWRHTAEGRALAALAGMGPNPRRRGLPDDLYQSIAGLYLDLQEAGWGRGILTEIARRKKVSRERARDYVHGATTRMYLAPGTPGRAGRKAGPALSGYTPSRVAGPKKSKRKG